MRLYLPSNIIKVILVFLLVLFGIGTVIYNQYLVDKILKQERTSVELWAKAIEFNALPIHEQTSTKLLTATKYLRLNKSAPDSIIRMIEDAETALNSQDFVTNELIVNEHDRFQIPTIVLDANDEILFYRNIDSLKLSKQQSRENLIKKYKSLNSPIKILIGDETRQLTQYVYFGESSTVSMLRFFPYIQFLLLSLLIGIGYTTYRSITRSEQSNLWVGMAKEAAHQLGTPISSLYGWIQLLRDEYRYDETANNIVNEIEKDVFRLREVAERFGKIGSEPELKPMEIEPVLEQVMSYMERRLPRLGKAVEVNRSLNARASVLINQELFQWAIENLIKNAMDSLQGKEGKMYISVSSNVLADEVIIDIEDSGSGIDKKHIKDIFRPGFSTKKRGWGLGLSLTKRIIEEYHKGSVFVLKTEPGTGTTMRIILRVNSVENKA